LSIAAVVPALACSNDPVEPDPADPVVPGPADPSPPDPIIIPPRSVSAEAAVLEKSNAFAWKLLPAAMAADPDAHGLEWPGHVQDADRSEHTLRGFLTEWRRRMELTAVSEPAPPIR